MNNFIKNINEESRILFNIIAGKEYQLRIVNENTDISHDFFYEIYCKAFNEVDKIIKENNAKEKDNVIETSNNIIAFCGERGQGKSSAMLSFSKILGDFGNKKYNKHFEEAYLKLKDYKFHVLSRIDPTELENQQTILSVIISRIFFDFKNYLDSNYKYNLEEKNNLLELFQQCYKNINIIKSENVYDKRNELYEDDLELLSSLSDGSNIKKDFFKLVESFLKFIYKDSKNKFLVIQVDDTDLNVRKAYEIVEDLRKYFMIPKVIVLMATKPEQLTKAVEQEFKKSFKIMSESNQLTSQEFYNMASKYIIKLIPGSRRIDLPEITVTSSKVKNNRFSIQYFDEENNVLNYKSNDNYQLEALQDILLRFIYEKTGLIFIKSENSMHDIIPNTARSLTNFMSVLNDMSPIKNISSFQELNVSNITVRLNNLNKFEDYFINSWIEENVNYRYHLIIKEWLKTPFQTKNQLIIYYLSKSILFNPNNIIEKNKKIFESYDDCKNSNSFRLCNVLNILNDIDNYYPLQDIHKFTFAIRTLYSITINKMLIQQVFDEFEAPDNIEVKYNTDIVSFIGNVFGDEINNFIPTENYKYNRAKFRTFINDEKMCEYVNKPFNNRNEFLVSLFFGDYPNGFSNDNENLYNFDVSLPLIRFLQPQGFIQSLNFDINLDFNDSNYSKIRYTCFQIISNLDLIQKLIIDLSFKSSSINNVKYVCGFYSRINKTLKKINYLKINEFDYSNIEHLITDISEWIEIIFENRKIYIDRETYQSRNSVRRARIVLIINDLFPYKLTDNIDLLKKRLNETLEVFTMIDNYRIVDVSFEKSELMKIINNTKEKTFLSVKTCKNHQATINKMRKSIKDKLQNYINR